jgi:uncharacterized protein (DUF1800 family)
MSSIVASAVETAALAAAATLAGIPAARGESAAARSDVDRVLKAEYRDHQVAYSLGAAYRQRGSQGIRANNIQ